MTIEFNSVRRTGKFLSDMPLREEHKLPYDIGVRAALKAAGIDRPDISISRHSDEYRHAFNLVMRDLTAQTPLDADVAQQLFYLALNKVWDREQDRMEFLYGALFAYRVKGDQLTAYEDRWGYHPNVFALQQHIGEKVSDITAAFYGESTLLAPFTKDEVPGLIRAAHLADFSNQSRYVLPDSKKMLDEILSAPSTGEYENEFFE